MKRSWRGAAATGLLLGLCALLILPAATALAADEPAGDEGNVSVTIVDGTSPTATPTPSPSSRTTVAPTPTRAGSTGASGTGAAGGSAPAGSAGDAAAPGEVGVGGMLFLGGLTSAVTLSPHPGDGTVTLWLTVRNASRSAIDADAVFWMEVPVLGLRIDTADVDVSGLQPGESRVVSAQLTHPGQWTVLEAHVTLTPPETVDGTALTPVTRDATVLVFPWLITAIVALAIIGYATFRALRAAVRVPAMAGTA